MSLYEQLASSRDGARRLAAAQLRYRTLGLLDSALRRSSLSKTELAGKLGIRKSAVSQVFRGDGNVRVNTLAEYAYALGYEIEMKLVPAGQSMRASKSEERRADEDWTGGSVAELTAHIGLRRVSQKDEFALSA